MRDRMIQSHKDLRKVKVVVGTGKRRKVLTYHTYQKLQKGDAVIVKGGYNEGEIGEVVAKHSWFWRKYTYEVRKAPPEAVKCPYCDTVFRP